MENDSSNINFDYTYVNAIARIAQYDDLKSAPRITKIQPDNTVNYIEKLTTTIYEQSKLSGGKIPYSVIREVSENFIHAQFREIIVSILDDGNTIRFADQGPGIKEKEKAQQPGFSSAIEPMKDYIRGVGSGLPIVNDYLNDRNGSIIIEDNLNSGAVVTISLVKNPEKEIQQATPSQEAEISFIPHIPLNNREKEFILLLFSEGELGITEIHNLTNLAASTVHNTLTKLEEAGLVEFGVGKKRVLTDLGNTLARSIS